MSMRYQRVSSPDGVPLSNVKRSITNGRVLHTTTNTPKPIVNGTSCSTLEGKGFRFRSPSRTTQDQKTTVEVALAPTSPQSENQLHDSPPPPAQIPTQNPKRDRSPSPNTSASPSPRRGAGEMLLQWGQRKRARVSRTDARVPTDDSASSSSSSAATKSQMRITPASSMPPPPPPPIPLPPACTSNGTTRPRREASSFLSNRNLEERSGCGGNGSQSRNGGRVLPRSTAGKRSPPPEKHARKLMMPCSGSAKDEKPNGSSDRVGIANQTLLEQESRRNNAAAPLAGGGGEKVSFEVTEWPRIYIALSRKEKEDDFLAMKGTKLSQRPKKRAKNIDKALQYCFPGMWLSDLTRNRYEVREKKCAKKQKRRGLKGMESFDSESE